MRVAYDAIRVGHGQFFRYCKVHVTCVAAQCSQIRPLADFETHQLFDASTPAQARQLAHAIMARHLASAWSPIGAETHIIFK
jgi:hypothetical protein